MNAIKLTCGQCARPYSVSTPYDLGRFADVCPDCIQKLFTLKRDGPVNTIPLTPSERNTKALSALSRIADIAEETRLSVGDILSAIRQIDVDAASAITRGHCMSITEIARSAIATITRD